MFFVYLVEAHGQVEDLVAAVAGVDLPRVVVVLVVVEHDLVRELLSALVADARRARRVVRLGDVDAELERRGEGGAARRAQPVLGVVEVLPGNDDDDNHEYCITTHDHRVGQRFDPSDTFPAILSSRPSSSR